ncbi:relaxase/mobilization nuclease domain-containing protein, partial [Chitinophagaceae bacterium LWZ2-11]
MISKILPARSFYHTCRYVTTKQDADIICSEGVRTYDYKRMAADFESQRQMHPSKTIACFHAILSFHPSEQPNDQLLRQIAGEYLQALGVTGTQFAVCQHTDRDHRHLHIIANMVNNNGKTISDTWIGLRGKKIAQQLTIHHGLIQAKEKNLALTHTESLNEYEAAKYKIYVSIAENLGKTNSLQGLTALLKKQGID